MSVITDYYTKEEKAVVALRDLFEKFGYRKFKMSRFEEYELYSKNKNFLENDNIITITDLNGKLLALKPDVTLSIVKNTLAGDNDFSGEQKVYYNENVYRVSENTHQFKEIMQAGLECIGDIDLYDIFETVSLAAQSLALISEDFVLQISHLGVLSAVLEKISPDQAFQQKVITCMKSKNPHDLARLCEQQGVDGTQLLQLLNAYGPRSKVLSQLESLDCPALQELKELSGLLDQLPWGDKIVFDFSAVNNMNYYNGIVYRGFLSGICESVLAGGQYDKLMEKLDRRAGAVGFAVYLDLLEQMPGEEEEYDVDVLLLYEADTDKAAVAKAVSALTSVGKTVSTQKSIPQKLRYRKLMKLSKEGTLC